MSTARDMDDLSTRAENRTIGSETENPSGVPGTTEVDNEVIASIAGHAARQVDGVVRLGTSGIVQSVAGRVESGAASHARGVKVEAGRREAIFDMDLIVAYGHPIPTVVEELRRSVSREVKEQTGLDTKAINLRVVGIQFEQEAPPERRVE